MAPQCGKRLWQMKKTTEMMPLFGVLFLDTPGHPTSAPQYSNSSKYTIYAHNNQTFGHSLRPPFFKGVKEEHIFWWILILIAMKLPFLPSVRLMRKCRVGKQDFTQVLPWVN